MKKLIPIFSLVFFSIVFISFANPVHAKESVYYESKPITFSGGSRAVNAVYADLNDNSLRMECVIAKNTIGLTDDLKKIAEQAKSGNTEVVAAINGTFFNSYSDMKPWGTLQSKGEFLRLGSSGSVIGFTADNKALIDTLRLSIRGSINECWDYPSNWYAWNINSMESDPDAIVILNSAFGKTTGKHSKTSIVVDNRKVTAIKSGEAPIPATGYVIVLQDRSVIQRFKVGDSVDYIFKTTALDKNMKPIAKDWSNVRTTVGAGPTLIKSGVIFADGIKEGFKEDKINKNRSQRSFAGVTKNNILILATVSNVSIKELAQIAKNMGCINAINLDGGASSGLYFKGKVVSSPGRKLSNVLVVTRVKAPATRLSLNGTEFISKNEPYIDSSSNELMVPLIDACRRLYSNYEIKGKNISFVKYTTRINMTLGETTYSLNNEDKISTTAPVIKNGVVYIPLHIIQDTFGGKITYDNKAKNYNAKINIVNINDLIKQAQIAADSKDFNKAIDLNLDILKLDPQNKLSHIRLAKLYNKTKKLDDSILQYKEFLKYEPDNIEALGGIAWANYSLKNPLEAIEYFDKSLRIQPKNVNHLTGKGLCYQDWSLKQHDRALECYQRALSCNPTDSEKSNLEKYIAVCKKNLGK